MRGSLERKIYSICYIKMNQTWCAFLNHVLSDWQQNLNHVTWDRYHNSDMFNLIIFHNIWPWNLSVARAMLNSLHHSKFGWCQREFYLKLGVFCAFFSLETTELHVYFAKIQLNKRPIAMIYKCGEIVR